MYKKHVVACLDILGFKAVIKDNLVDIQSIWNVLRSFKISESQQQVSREGNGLTILPNVIAFSDNIAITVCPSDLGVSEIEALIAVLTHIHQAISCSIKNGLLVRGAITVGDLYSEDGMIFGPAWNQAAELEKDYAKYPRVIFSDESLEVLNLTHYKSMHCKSDEDKVSFFDHLGIICKNRLEDGEEVFHALNMIIQREESNKTIEDKITWLKQYYNPAKDEWERIRFQALEV